MALPTGLVPWLVLALTVGVPLTTALVAETLQRRQSGEFARSLRGGLVITALLYLSGVGVVWAASGFLVTVAAALLVVGLFAAVVVTALPLWTSAKLLTRSGFDYDDAIRRSTGGWPVAGSLTFLLYATVGRVLPWSEGATLLAVRGPEMCLVGFCGVAVAQVGVVAIGLVILTVGPAVVGAAARLDPPPRQART